MKIEIRKKRAHYMTYTEQIRDVWSKVNTVNISLAGYPQSSIDLIKFELLSKAFNLQNQAVKSAREGENGEFGAEELKAPSVLFLVQCNPPGLFSNLLELSKRYLGQPFGVAGYALLNTVSSYELLLGNDDMYAWRVGQLQKNNFSKLKAVKAVFDKVKNA